MKEDLRDDIHHIRKMMEQSSTFISLSGLSGVAAGIVALLGSTIAYTIGDKNGLNYNGDYSHVYIDNTVWQLVGLAMVVLILAVGMGIIFTVRKTKKNGTIIWTSITRKLVTALIVPLVAGGMFCLAAIYQRHFVIVMPATLVFYGLALINASKYTYSDIQKLGYCEIVLGIVALFLNKYHLLFWAFGFGIMHIFYGLLMYKKYK